MGRGGPGDATLAAEADAAAGCAGGGTGALRAGMRYKRTKKRVGEK